MAILNDREAERHPLQPFLPEGARLLMLGSFPPPRYRWSMEFFYPNRNNQMWEMMGMIFYGDGERLIDRKGRGFRQAAIEQMLRERGIAIFDSCEAVVRQQRNASDMLLTVVEATDIAALLRRLPLCHHIACTGQKAATTVCEQYGAAVPAMGESVTIAVEGRDVTLHRMPSTSRAYPMPIDEKAAYYRAMLREAGCL